MRTCVSFSLVLFVLGCSSRSDSSAANSGHGPEVAPAVQVENTQPDLPAPEARVCASAIVVSFQGAEHASEAVRRTKEEARARAEEIRAALERGEDFAATARRDSDAASSGSRGGLIGTYLREEWPIQHRAILEPTLALAVGQTSEVLEAPYGWVIVQRCPIESIHTRHILVRYRGARNAPSDLTRTREEARSAAQQMSAQLRSEEAEFGALAREKSEDGSAEVAGDLGVTFRGRLAPSYELAAYALAPNQISEPVESEFGFHLIQRLPN